MGSGTTAKMAMLNNRRYIGFELNTDYYNGILMRLDKFRDSAKRVEERVDVEGESCSVSAMADSDREVEEKTKLFNDLVGQLNVYFNEQSLSILKTLTLTFKSESNDKRVQKLMDERKDEI